MDAEDKLVFGKETFTNRIKGNISTKYDPVKELGHGSYGKVYKVKNKLTGEFRACKQLSKSKIDNIPKFNLEIDILCKTDHPNIIRLYEIYEDSCFFYLIMEECVGGELFERIIKRINAQQMFSEKQAAVIFTELMSAICYCHSQHIIHRDLKPENILFLSEDETSPIKVIDFGLSKKHTDGHNEKIRMKTKVGTAYYVSPEVLKGNYNEKCDIWSAGVILYLLLSGEPPFNGPNDNAIYRSIIKKKFTFPEMKWKDISVEAKDLISNMLCDPDKRLTAQQVLQHDWVTNVAQKNTIDLNLDVQSLENYKNTYKLKKAVITYIASRLKDSDISDLIKVFEEIDKNKDGTITLDEMKDGIEKMNQMIDIDITELFKSIDTDKSGSISYTEFVAASMDQKIYMKEERLYEAFKTFDNDDNGKISKEELKQVLKAELVDLNDFEAIVNQYDKDGDGEIDYNEFLSMMNNNTNTISTNPTPNT